MTVDVKADKEPAGLSGDAEFRVSDRVPQANKGMRGGEAASPSGGGGLRRKQQHQV